MEMLGLVLLATGVTVFGCVAMHVLTPPGYRLGLPNWVRRLGGVVALVGVFAVMSHGTASARNYFVGWKVGVVVGDCYGLWYQTKTGKAWIGYCT